MSSARIFSSLTSYIGEGPALSEAVDHRKAGDVDRNILKTGRALGKRKPKDRVGKRRRVSGESVGDYLLKISEQEKVPAVRIFAVRVTDETKEADEDGRGLQLPILGWWLLHWGLRKPDGRCPDCERSSRRTGLP